MEKYLLGWHSLTYCPVSVPNKPNSAFICHSQAGIKTSHHLKIKWHSLCVMEETQIQNVVVVQADISFGFNHVKKTQ